MITQNSEIPIDQIVAIAKATVEKHRRECALDDGMIIVFDRLAKEVEYLRGCIVCDQKLGDFVDKAIADREAGLI